jgi:hypothetical protein
MANEVANKNGSTALSTETNPFQAYGEASRQTSIVGKLLKFSKGDWFCGQDDDDVADGSLFVANMDELMVGWIRWSDNKPTDHVMGKVSDRFQPPRRNELGDDDKSMWETDEQGKDRDPWQFSNYLLMMNVNDKAKVTEDSELFTFTTSSRGGLNAIGDLCVKYGKGMRSHKEQYPIVKIGNGSYQHSNKSFGRIKYPTFEIVGWMNKVSFLASEGSEREPDSEEVEIDEKDLPKPTQVKAETANINVKDKADTKAKSKARF